MVFEMFVIAVSSADQFDLLLQSLRHGIGIPPLLLALAA
jgi:hypothetical protein